MRMMLLKFVGFTTLLTGLGVLCTGKVDNADIALALFIMSGICFILRGIDE